MMHATLHIALMKIEKSGKSLMKFTSPAVGSTRTKFGIHLFQDLFSKKSMLPKLKIKMAMVFQNK